MAKVCSARAAAALALLVVNARAETSAVDAALAAEIVDEEAVCEAGQGEACENALSLRQLRGELQVGDVQQHRARSIGDTTSAPPAANASADDNFTISCTAAHHYCRDYMAYRSKDECAEDATCKVLDVSSVGGDHGEAWYCAPADDSCEAKYSEQDFLDSDFEPPEVFQGDEEENQTAEDLLNTSMGAAANYNVHRRRGIVPRRRYQAAASQPWHPNPHAPPPPPPSNNSFHGTSNISGLNMTLYHTTSKSIAAKIVENGFLPGHGGWCGGAIYFLDTPHLPKSKFNPRTTKTGAILKATVRMGDMGHFNKRCNSGNHWGRGWQWGVHAAQREGHNSLSFNPGDGNEFVIWDTQQVVDVQIYQYMW